MKKTIALTIFAILLLAGTSEAGVLKLAGRGTRAGLVGAGKGVHVAVKATTHGVVKGTVAVAKAVKWFVW